MKTNSTYKLLFNNLWLHGEDVAHIDQTQYQPAEPSSQLEQVSSPELTVVATTTAPPTTRYTATVATDTPINIASEPTKLTTKQVEIITTVTTAADTWDELCHKVINCRACGLCGNRRQTVLERGNRHAPWLFVGEGPGEEEDKQGLPFVGNSGQLLDKMISAMGLLPEKDVYICNVVKCRPPANRNPSVAEITACKDFLFKQISLVAPKIIIALGRFASQTLINSNLATAKLRGQVHQFAHIPTIVTYHPAYLLRNPAAKKDAWEDLQLAMKVFNDKHPD